MLASSDVTSLARIFYIINYKYNKRCMIKKVWEL